MFIRYLLLLFLVKYGSCRTLIQENSSGNIVKKTDGFLLSVPRILVSGRNESVCLSLHETRVPAKAIIDLKWKEKHFPTTRYLETEHSCFDLYVPFLDKVDPQLVSIRVQVQINDIIQSAHNQDPILLYPTKVTKTFINTDRDVYKPGDKVKFRVFVIDEQFLPQNSELKEIKIKNPLDVTVAVWNDVKPENGIVSMEYQMVSEAITGKWKIECSGESKTFEVYKYVLPRFKINLTYPKLIYYKAEYFNITVCGQYSHGRYVNGLAFIKVTDSYNNMVPITQMKWMTNGCSKFTLTSQETMMSRIKEKFPMNDPKMHIHITATVTEKGTNRMGITTEKSLVFLKPYTMKFVSESIFRPGLIYTGQIKLNNVQIELSEEIIEICYNVAIKKSWNYLNSEQCSNFTVDDGNTVNFSILPMKSNIIHIHLSARSLNHTEIGDSFLVVRLFSPSGSYISLHQNILDKTEDECRSAQQFAVYFTTNKLNDEQNIRFYYMVKSQSKIYKMKDLNHTVSKSLSTDFNETKNIIGNNHKFLKLGTGVDSFLIKFRLDKKIGNRYQLLVYYVTNTGEIVAASKNVDVEPCLLKVDAKWQQSRMVPGATAKLDIKTGVHSICSVSAVDKSTQFLSNTHHSFNLNSLLRSFNTFEIEYPVTRRKTCVAQSRRSSQVSSLSFDMETETQRSTWDLRRRKRYIYPFSEDFDSYDVFNNFGTVTITNLRIVTKHCYNGPILKDSRPVQFLTDQYDDHNEEKFVSVRSYFPDTWLWELIPVSNEVQLNRHLPHSITRWVTNVLCISDQDGIGFSEETEITSFQTFFIEIITPFSVKRGENFYMYIHVSNYLNHSFPIRITLRLSKGLELRDPKEDTIVSFCLSANSTITHTVNVKGSELGIANVTVLAETDNQYPKECGPETVVSKRDIILKSIQVESEGYLMTTTKSALLCSSDSHNPSNISWLISPHKDIIPGTETIYVNLNGDLLGPTIENLDQLLEVPTGCGEQIMASMVPNLYILRYLNATNSLKTSIRYRIIRNLKMGYQRILNYIHRDGSFSAFGYHDPMGSMFLTAFVVRTLKEAKQYIYVDQKIIDKAVQWIFDHQLENGCFNTMLHVFQDMGGTSKENSTASLTAYVIISLTEANIEIPKEVQTNAKYCLRSQYNPDKYTLAISCYALFKIHWIQEAERLLNKLLALANQQQNMLWWSGNENETTATDIEITGYVLHSLLYRNTTENLANAHSVVKWLSTKYGAKGAFRSTQDTAVALDSLAKYSTLITSRKLDLEVTIITNESSMTVAMESEEKLKSKQFSLDKNVTDISIIVNGQGCVLAQVTHSYYLRHVPKSETFKLAVDVAPVSTIDPCSITSLSPCIAYTGPNGPSNMAVMEISLPSGYQADRASLYSLIESEDISRVKMFEELENKVNIYFTKLDKQLTCFSFNINENTLVGTKKDSLVKLYDYYKPEYEIIQFYSVNNCNVNNTVEIPQVFANLLDSSFEIDNKTDILTQIPQSPENRLKRDTIYVNSTVEGIEHTTKTGLNKDFVDTNVEMEFSNCNGNIPFYILPSKNTKRDTHTNTSESTFEVKKSRNVNNSGKSPSTNPFTDLIKKDTDIEFSNCNGNVPYYTVKYEANKRHKRELKNNFSPIKSAYVKNEETHRKFKLKEFRKRETNVNEESKLTRTLNPLFFNMDVEMDVPKGMEGNMPTYIKPTSEELKKMNST